MHAMQRAFDALQAMVQSEVSRRKSEFDVETEEPTDYVSSYLKEMHQAREQQNQAEFFSEGNLVSNCSE